MEFINSFSAKFNKNTNQNMQKMKTTSAIQTICLCLCCMMPPLEGSGFSML